jgi:4-amino-4-deoxy-L-arabinose transferase-like glycosyltransferase
VWLAIPWLALELIRGKAPTYVLPCYCPLMILLAWQLSALWKSAPSFDPPNPAERRLPLLWAKLMIAAGLLLTVAGCIPQFRLIGHALLAIGLAMVAGFTLVLLSLLRNQLRTALATAIVSLLVFQILLGTRLLPALEPLGLSRRIAESINQARSKLGDKPALVCGYDEPVMHFYLAKPVQTVGPGELAEQLRLIEGPCLIAIHAKDRDTLPPQVTRELMNWPQTSLSGLNYGKMRKTVVQIIEVPAGRLTAGTPAGSASAPTK